MYQQHLNWVEVLAVRDHIPSPWTQASPPGSDMEYLFPSKITGYLRYVISTEPLSSGGDIANIPSYLWFLHSPDLLNTVNSQISSFSLSWGL